MGTKVVTFVRSFMWPHVEGVYKLLDEDVAELGGVNITSIQDTTVREDPARSAKGFAVRTVVYEPKDTITRGAG